MENYEGFYFTVVAATQSMSPEVADVLGCNIRPQLVVNLLTLQLHLFRIQLSVIRDSLQDARSLVNV